MLCLQNVFVWSKQYYDTLYQVLHNHFTYHARTFEYKGDNSYIILFVISIDLYKMEFSKLLTKYDVRRCQ